MEAGTHLKMGKLRSFQNRWEDAVTELEQAIEIADDIGSPVISRPARVHLALVRPVIETT